MGDGVELVSILIPAYKPTFFRVCLTSALAQTWENKEIIVSDDCPTSAIRDICLEYSGLVRYIRNPSPGVLGHNNIRHLCAIAKGVYLKYLFDDDILHPFCVQYLVEALNRQKPNNAMLAFSPRMTIDSENHTVGRVGDVEGGFSGLVEGREIIRRLAKTLVNPIGEFTTVLFRRRDVFDDAGNMQLMTVNGVPWRGLSDVALFIHLCAKGPVVAVSQTLSYFRVHDESNSNPASNPEWFFAVADWRLVLEYAVKHNVLSQLETVKAYRKLLRLLQRWQLAAPSLQDQFAAVIRDIQEDLDDQSSPEYRVISFGL